MDRGLRVCKQRKLSLLNEASFRADCRAIHLTVNLVIAVRKYVAWVSLMTHGVSSVTSRSPRDHRQRSHLSGNSSSSVITHIWQAGLLMNKQDSLISRHDSSEVTFLRNHAS